MVGKTVVVEKSLLYEEVEISGPDVVVSSSSALFDLASDTIAAARTIISSFIFPELWT